MFLHWKAYNDLYMSELYNKEEYYYAQICQTIMSSAGITPEPLKEYLISFKPKTEEEIEEERIKANEEFMAASKAVPIAR